MVPLAKLASSLRSRSKDGSTSLFEWTVTWGGAEDRHIVLASTPERSVIPANGLTTSLWRKVSKNKGAGYARLVAVAPPAPCSSILGKMVNQGKEEL